MGEREGQYIELLDDSTLWRFEPDFLRSRWTCIWGRGCKGILDAPAEHLQQGCCSVGAELTDLDEAMNVSALASTVPAHLWQHHHRADGDDVFNDASRTNTKVVDGACIFLNRPGFEGGAGCALHLAALEYGESPVDWKPSVCWQLPIRVEWDMQPNGIEHATVRAWNRADWGDEGTTMAWCCTEEPEAYVGDQPVIESLAEELAAVVGESVYVALRRRLNATP
ncbi:MAG: hypothetical protein WCI22_02025 [Actinomycetota bacterium]